MTYLSKFVYFKTVVLTAINKFSNLDCIEFGNKEKAGEDGVEVGLSGGVNDGKLLEQIQNMSITGIFIG